MKCIRILYILEFSLPYGQPIGLSLAWSFVKNQVKFKFRILPAHLRGWASGSWLWTFYGHKRHYQLSAIWVSFKHAFPMLNYLTVPLWCQTTRARLSNATPFKRASSQHQVGHLFLAQITLFWTIFNYKVHGSLLLGWALSMPLWCQTARLEKRARSKNRRRRQTTRTNSSEKSVDELSQR